MRHSKKKGMVAINLTLSPEDKRWIKVYAAAHDTTVSEVLRRQIQMMRNLQVKGVDRNGECKSQCGESCKE